MDQYFKRIANFEGFKETLGLEKTLDSEWGEEQPNGVSARSLISEKESIKKNLTYIGLKFFKPTDGHYYRTQTDTILFVNTGTIEFMNERKERHPHPFLAGTTVQIPPPVIRKIIPSHQNMPLEIELIVQPRYNFEDEVHVYD